MMNSEEPLDDKMMLFFISFHNIFVVLDRP